MACESGPVQNSINPHAEPAFLDRAQSPTNNHSGRDRIPGLYPYRCWTSLFQARTLTQSFRASALKPVRHVGKSLKRLSVHPSAALFMSAPSYASDSSDRPIEFKTAASQESARNAVWQVFTDEKGGSALFSALLVSEMPGHVWC
jgi:hypothetical protein